MKISQKKMDIYCLLMGTYDEVKPKRYAAKEIAKFLEVSDAYISKVINKFVIDGYIAPDGVHNRRKRYSATRKKPKCLVNRDSKKPVNSFSSVDLVNSTGSSHGDVSSTSKLPHPCPSENLSKVIDKRPPDPPPITKRQYVAYTLFTAGMLNQTKVAKEMGIKPQGAHKFAKRLELQGFIKTPDENANPKFFKPTNVTPGVSPTSAIIVSKSARKVKRRVGRTLKTVRDRKTGRFLGKRKGRGEGFHRDYDTILSIDGKRIPVLRVHSLSYTCTILREPMKKVPWERKKGPKGMEQWVLCHKFPNKKSEIDELKELNITFVRQKTKNYDELVIYMPEKYIFEFELEKTKKIMEKYVWKARKWFQSNYKLWLGLALPYREMEIAREIFDPALRRWVQENGMAKVQTKRGRGIVDESKKGFPEREFTSIEQVRADLESGDRILDLEEQMSQLMEQTKKLMNLSDKNVTNQKRIIDAIQEGKKETEQTQSQVLELAGEVRKISTMQNKTLLTFREYMERNQTGRIMVGGEKHQDSNIDNT